MKFLFPYMARWHAANWSRYHQLLSALCRLGHQILVLQPPALALAETNYTEIDAVVTAGLTLYEVVVPQVLWRQRLPMEKLVKKGFYTLASRKTVQRLIRDQQIDVLLIYNLPQHMLAYQAPCFRVFDVADDLPAMLAHEVGHPLGAPAQRVAARWLRRLALDCELVTVASQTLQEQLPVPSLLLPNGVCMDQLLAADGAAVRQKLHSPVVGYLGAFEYFVDMKMVIEAARQLPQVTFLLVGGGRDLESIRRQVAAYELSNVILPGAVAHATGLDYVAAMDICLIPFAPGPVADGACPLKLFEYMGLRKVVISTRTAEMRRIAHDDVLWADTTDELVETIQCVLDSSDNYEELKTQAYKKVVSEYLWDTIATRFVTAIERSI